MRRKMATQSARLAPGSVVSLKGYILQAKELPGLSARQLEHRLEPIPVGRVAM